MNVEKIIKDLVKVDDLDINLCEIGVTNKELYKHALSVVNNQSTDSIVTPTFLFRCGTDQIRVTLRSGSLSNILDATFVGVRHYSKEKNIFARGIDMLKEITISHYDEYSKAEKALTNKMTRICNDIITDKINDYIFVIKNLKKRTLIN